MSLALSWGTIPTQRAAYASLTGRLGWTSRVRARSFVWVAGFVTGPLHTDETLDPIAQDTRTTCLTQLFGALFGSLRANTKEGLLHVHRHICHRNSTIRPHRTDRIVKSSFLDIAFDLTSTIANLGAIGASGVVAKSF